MSVTRKDILRKLRESTHYSGCAENAEKAGISASEILNFLVDELDHQYDRAQLRKLTLLDTIDEQTSVGKLDLIIQLPYVIKNDTRRDQAERRRKDIEAQLAGSKYGIAYTDGTERITQLNRSLDNTLTGRWRRRRRIMTRIYETLKIGTRQTWHFTCPLCGQEWYDNDTDNFSVGESVMPGSYQFRVFQARAECECCGLLVYSETKQIPNEQSKPGRSMETIKEEKK